MNKMSIISDLKDNNEQRSLKMKQIILSLLIMSLIGCASVGSVHGKHTPYLKTVTEKQGKKVNVSNIKIINSDIAQREANEIAVNTRKIPRKVLGYITMRIVDVTLAAVNLEYWDFILEQNGKVLNRSGGKYNAGSFLGCYQYCGCQYANTAYLYIPDGVEPPYNIRIVQFNKNVISYRIDDNQAFN